MKTLARFLSVISCWLIGLSMLLLSMPASAVDNIDMPGNDYDNFEASSPFICRNSCGGDSKCQGWTWVKPGIQGPSGRCWLKFKLPALVKNSCCNSGPRNFIAPSDLKAENNTDRAGLDYRNFEIDSWAQCESACGGDQRCAAWAYARPGFQGPRGRCWLKNRVPHPLVNANVISGVKYRAASVPFDDGTNLIPANE